MFKHPARVCMTYWSHFNFSMYLSKEFAKASCCAFIHAIYPDTLITHSSDTIKKLHIDMTNKGCGVQTKNETNEGQSTNKK